MYWWAAHPKSPLVRAFCQKLLGMVPFTGVDPDEAIALGAALEAAMKERNAAVREVILTDVCPFTLGTEVSAFNGTFRRMATMRLSLSATPLSP